MIKCETVGMIEVSKNNPILTSTNDVVNYDFITVNDILYLICNTVTGDDAYREDVTIKAGEFLNGYQVDAWAGQKLVIDTKHIVGTEYASLNVNDYLAVGEDGKLKKAADKPASGVYFKITEKTALTENAVKAIVCVA